LRDLLPDHRAPHLAAVDRAGVPDVLDGTRNAVHPAARRDGHGRDRGIMARAADVAGADDLDGDRTGPGPAPARPDGQARVGVGDDAATRGTTTGVGRLGPMAEVVHNRIAMLRAE